MKVRKWISREEIKDQEISIGGLGGWFKKGMRWEDYQDSLHKEVVPYAKAVRKSVVENEFRFGGDTHQESMTPLFEDGTIGEFSFRAWGDLMAAIWSTEDGRDYEYMSFYMTGYRDAK